MLSVSDSSSRSETAFRAAFHKAGYDQPAEDRLQVIIVESLAKAKGNRAKAAKAAAAKIMSDRELAIAAMMLLMRHAQEMPGKGQATRALNKCQSTSAPSRQPDDNGEGHTADANGGQTALAPPLSPKGSEEGHSFGADNGRIVTAPSLPSNSEAEGQKPDAENGPKSIAPVSLPVTAGVMPYQRDKTGKYIGNPKGPTDAQRAAALSGQTVKTLSIFDTFKLSNGSVLGTLRLGELERHRMAFVKDAAIIRMIQKHAIGSPDMLVKDALKEDLFQRMIQKGAEIADAS